MIPSSSEVPVSGANIGGHQAGETSPAVQLGFPPAGFTAATGSSSRVPAAAPSVASLPVSDGSGVHLGSPAPSPTADFTATRFGSTPNAANLGFQPSPNPGQFPTLTSNFERPARKATFTADSRTTAQQQHAPQQQTPPAATPQPAVSTPQRTSFAEIAARKSSKPPDLFVHNFTAISPVMMNDGLTVIMPSSMYEQQLLKFQFALIGRILLPQGTAPKSTEDLKSELVSLFQTSGDWILLSLGKGFFSLQFRLKEDQLRAMRRISWRLSSGSFQLREWQPHFDPYKELSSTAQLWVRLFHLPVEYWHPEFLVGIFRSVGNVIKLDGNTAQGLVGHFARALVEVDLTKPLPESVRVGLHDNLFFVDFSYENIPLLCSFCHYIGHSVDNCRKAKAAPDENGNDEGVQKPTAPARNKKKWVVKDKEIQQPNRIVPIGNVIEKIQPEQDKLKTSNAFDALQTHDAEDFVPEPTPYEIAGSQGQAALQNRDSGDESVLETPLDVGDIMDKVTGSSGLIGKELTRELLTTAREHSMNRQLRLERQGAADKAAAVGSDSGEEPEMDLPPSTLLHKNVDMATAAPVDSLSGQNEAAEKQAVAVPNADDLNAAAGPCMLMTGEEEKNKNVTLATAPAKSISKRTRNKRKTTVSSTRQLRSSTKNKSISETTPEMIDAYIRSQCPPKATHVANPKLAYLEDQLRAAAAIGRHTNAYVLDSGHKAALTSMNLVDNQQWGEIPLAEVYSDTDLHSD